MKQLLKNPISLILLAGGLIIHSPETKANIYTVTNTNNTGAGSLRNAITNANTNPGRDTIRFNIGVAGNLFEGTAPNTYAVIELSTALPAITGDLFIDGTTQADSNPGSFAAQAVGVDNIMLSAIALPDVYIVPAAGFSFPINSTGVNGNGISVDGSNVTIRGIAISGFGNTSTNGGTASGHSDIALLRSPTARTANVTIEACVLSADPTGAFPALAHRRTKGNGILVCGNNDNGSISNNYIAHSGTYGIHFNGNTDNNGVGPASTTVACRNWVVSGNRVINVTTNSTISALTRVSDGITLMKCVAFDIINNYIENPEQMGIDIGYNSDSNYVSNNTVTGFVKTTAFQIQAGLRIGLCSEADTLENNLVYNNTGTSFKAGVWIDRSTLSQPGVVAKSNANNVIRFNTIHSNNGSGVVLSNNSTGSCMTTVISRNSIYNNIGLGIDINFNGTAGATQVSVNDDGDADTGPNDMQNFPILDSVRQISPTQIAFYGKAPAGSTIEFFLGDGQLNNHGGLSLNYGEGKTYIGSLVEGSAQDGAAGTGSYNVDGNIAFNNANLFFAVLNYAGPITSVDSVTATATLGNNTSEFGPLVRLMEALDCKLLSFTSSYNNSSLRLNWEAISDDDFLYFDVEYSSDGRTFNAVKRVYPHASNIICKYEFVQNDPGTGRHYYRLRIVNRMGKPEFSSTVAVKVTGQVSDGLKNMASTFTDRIDIRLESQKDQLMGIQLFNEAGTLIKYNQVNARKGQNFIQFDNLQSLARGVYIVHVKTESGLMTKRIIKQ